MQGRVESPRTPELAKATISDALALALQSFDDILAIEAYARLVWVDEYRDPPESWAVMTELARRTGAPGSFGRALMLNNLGARHYRARENEKARAVLNRALEEATLNANGDPEDIELLAILRNLAFVENNAVQRQTLMLRVATALAGELGENHPSAIAARESTAMLTTDLRQARLLIEATCPNYGSWKLLAAQAECAYQRWLAG